jgi:hypothetical protein
MKTRLLIYKLRKRSSAIIRTVSLQLSSDVEERLDIHRQRMTKALLYLLISTCEVHHPRQLACCLCRYKVPTNVL